MDRTLQPPDRPVVIAIKKADGKPRPEITINDEEVSLENLGDRLTLMYAFRQEKLAFVKGGPEIDFEYVAEVVDAAHRIGVQRVGLLGSERSNAAK